ncbi:hypothetical protein ACFSL6_17905 [Paenibacillus thailandensis]|uniref:Uncharacterized protein n=1 Tax=Paenibacillus thailandensis TaxID=393250 RepID=A0ABW5QRH3_9BACL
MAFIGVIVFLAFIVFLIMGIVAAIRKDGKAKRWFAISGSAFVISIILISVSPDTTSEPANSASNQTADAKAEKEKQAKLNAEEETKAKEAAAAEEAKKAEEAKAAAEEAKKAEEEAIPGTIGMTPEEFKEAFNSAAKEFDASFNINKLTVEEGQVQNTFQVMFTDNLGLTGTVNKKDGSVRDVMIMGAGDGTVESGTDIILAIGTLIASTNPTLTADERGDVLGDLGLLDENMNINDLDKSTIRNGIKYHIMGSDVIGIMFSAGDANEKE